MSFSESSTFVLEKRGCGLPVFFSALATAIAVAVVVLISEGLRDVFLLLIAFPVALIGALLVIGLASAIIGLPLTHVLESNGWERPWSYPLAGFVFGAAIIFIFLEALGPPPSWSSEVLAFLLIGALPGALCGTLWWLFERRHVEREVQGK